MKTKSLLLAAAVLISSSAFAQSDVDVTPSHYDLNSYSVGVNNFTNYATIGKANPAPSFDIKLAGSTGCVVFVGGQFDTEETIASIVENLNAGTSIVQLETGHKVLLIKGQNSTENTSAPAIAASVGGW